MIPVRMRGMAPHASAVAAVALLSFVPAMAARIPSWAKPVIENAPDLPEEHSSMPSRVLLSEVREEVREDGSVDVRYRLISQALSASEGGISVGGFHFEETMKVTSSKAWHVPPGKRAKKSWEAPVDVTLDSSFLSDSKVRIMHVDDVQEGSAVIFEFEAREEPYFLPRVHYFGESIETRTARYQIEVPEEWEIKWEWVRGSGPAPEIQERTWTWQLTDLQVPPDEPLGKSQGELVPIVAVNLLPPDTGEVKPAAFSGWADFSVWYEKLSGDRHKPSSDIEAAAARTMGPAGDDYFGRLRAVGSYVRDMVRYVDIELGIGAMQPRPAGETFTNLYGDCKDKGTLFRSMLGTTRQATYPVLVNLTNEDTVAKTVPGWGFNHYVVAVPIPPELEVPGSFRPATLELEDLGRLLIVDTTSEGTSIGAISANLAGKTALIVAGEKGRLVTLPGRVPEAHTFTRRLQVQPITESKLSARSESRYTGEFARVMRLYHRRSSAEFRSDAERGVLERWPSAEIQDFEVEAETPEGAFVESIAFTHQGSGRNPDEPAARIFPGFADSLRRVPLRRREGSVDYGFPRLITFESTLAGVPESAAVPEPREMSGDGWTVRTSYVRGDGTVRATARLELVRTEFPPGLFDELRGLWNALRRVESRVVVVGEPEVQDASGRPDFPASWTTSARGSGAFSR